MSSLNEAGSFDNETLQNKINADLHPSFDYFYFTPCDNFDKFTLYDARSVARASRKPKPEVVLDALDLVITEDSLTRTWSKKGADNAKVSLRKKENGWELSFANEVYTWKKESDEMVLRSAEGVEDLARYTRKLDGAIIGLRIPYSEEFFDCCVISLAFIKKSPEN